MNRFFLDTAYAIALSNPTDQHHARAKALARQLRLQGAKFITTRAVMIEIANSFAKQRYRNATIKILKAIEADKSIEKIAISDELYKQAFQLYCERPDKEWGLTDCISFVVMKDRGLTDALTADTHFKQAGFNVLLK